MRKQKSYQHRIGLDAAVYFDSQCERYHWSASTANTVILELMERIQKAASAFQIGVGADGEEMVGFRLPSGEFELLEGDEAEDLAKWFIKEIQKGLVGAFLPDGAEPGLETYFDVLDADYPDSAIGAAMMAVDGVKPKKEISKR